MRGISVRTLAKHFLSARGGNFAIATAAVVSVLAMGAGFALNVTQMTLTRSNLIQALDSAVTSTARDLTTGKISEEDARPLILTFLQVNGGTGFAAQERITLDSVVVDRSARTVTARAAVELDVAFALFGTGRTQRIEVESSALYSDKKIEVAMMLDVTGSMAGQRIKDLQSAARNAVDTFLTGQDVKDPRVRVAIIPYADAVNVGALAHTVHVETSYTMAEPPRMDDPKAASASRPDNCGTERKGTHQFRDTSPMEAMVSRDVRLAFCPQATLQPLTADAAKLKSSINAFKASGHTAGAIGIQWSWYMLSPKWADVLPAASRPLAHDPRGVAKFAILMTDGEFNTAFAGVPNGQNVRNQPVRSRDNAEKLCAEMKKQGIEIFTIGFMLNQAGAKTVMKNCASPDKGATKHYFETSSGAELDAAFQSIAANIERLAIVK